MASFFSRIHRLILQNILHKFLKVIKVIPSRSSSKRMRILRKTTPPEIHMRIPLLISPPMNPSEVSSRNLAQVPPRIPPEYYRKIPSRIPERTASEISLTFAHRFLRVLQEFCLRDSREIFPIFFSKLLLVIPLSSRVAESMQTLGDFKSKLSENLSF